MRIFEYIVENEACSWQEKEIERIRCGASFDLFSQEEKAILHFTRLTYSAQSLPCVFQNASR